MQSAPLIGHSSFDRVLMAAHSSKEHALKHSKSCLVTACAIGALAYYLSSNKPGPSSSSADLIPIDNPCYNAPCHGYLTKLFYSFKDTLTNVRWISTTNSSFALTDRIDDQPTQQPFSSALTVFYTESKLFPNSTFSFTKMPITPRRAFISVKHRASNQGSYCSISYKNASFKQLKLQNSPKREEHSQNSQDAYVFNFIRDKLPSPFQFGNTVFILASFAGLAKFSWRYSGMGEYVAKCTYDLFFYATH